MGRPYTPHGDVIEQLIRETEEGVHEDGIEDIPDMVAHVYLSNGTTDAACGLPLSQDAHGQMQLSRGEYYHYRPGDTACGDCGAPICPVCLPILRQSHRKLGL